MQRTLTITNPSHTNWTLERIDSPCSCTVPTTDFAVIPANQSESITISYRGPHRTTDHRRSIKLYFREFPGRPGLIEISAWVRRTAEIRPPRIDLGNVARDRQHEAILLIQNFSDQTWGDLTISTTADWIQASASPLPAPRSATNERVKPRQQWRLLTISDTSDLASTEFREHIHVTPCRNGSAVHDTMTIPFSLTVRRPVSVIPGRFFFGRLRPGDVRSSRVTLRFTRGAEPHSPPDVHVSDESLLQATLTHSSSTTWTITASLTAPHDGQLPDPLALTFTAEAIKPITIPVFASVDTPK